MKTIILKATHVETVSYDDQRITLESENGLKVQLHLNKDAAHVQNIDDLKDTKFTLTIGETSTEKESKSWWKKILTISL